MSFTKIAAAGIGSTETVTLHSLEVLNNATIGGVLTYEDVTNVDSIGIITARAGVLVGSGITLSKDGDIFATGVTTATSFVGALTGNVTGNISGGTVAGSTGTFTGDVDIADKIIHTGDTDTAIRFSGADTITAETGGSERLRIASDGNIGINATSPTCPLQINSGSGGDGTVTFLELNHGGNNTNDAVKLNFARAGGDCGSISLEKVASNNTTDFIFNTRASNTVSESMRITGGGDVGIGVTNPEKTLHVHGNALIEDTIGNNLEIRSTVNNGNDPNFYFSKARGGGTPAIVQNGDDIGNFQWRGYDGDSYETGASILCEVNGTPADGDMPMRMTLKTRSAGAGSEQGRLRLDAAGDVSVMTGNLVISTAGKGIDFSATGQGINSSSMSSELLDDYEEGSWTPQIHTQNGNSNASYDYQTGYYTKIGNRVLVNFSIMWSGATNHSGYIYVNNFPYTSGNVSHNNSIGSIMVYNLPFSSSRTDIVLYMGSNSSGTNIYYSGTNTGWDPGSNTTDGRIIGSMQYLAT